MTPAEHYAEAERLLDAAMPPNLLTGAQIHATLASCGPFNKDHDPHEDHHPMSSELWYIVHTPSSDLVDGPFLTSGEAVARIAHLTTDYAVTRREVTDEDVARILHGAVAMTIEEPAS